MSLIYEDKTKILRRCFFDVQNEVGLGRQEEAYHQACKLWFEKHDLPVASKPPHRLMLLGHCAYTVFPDFVAWDAISVELKALARAIAASERVQLFDYLKRRGDRLGLMVNMGLDRVQVERFVYDPPPSMLNEDWTYWQGHVDGPDRDTGTAIRDVLIAIYQEHGAGYGLEAMGRFVLTFTALCDTNDFNMNRGRSYMRTLGLPWGVAVNFGRSKVEIVGLRNQKANSRMAEQAHG